MIEGLLWRAPRIPTWVKNFDKTGSLPSSDSESNGHMCVMGQEGRQINEMVTMVQQDNILGDRCRHNDMRI